MGLQQLTKSLGEAGLTKQNYLAAAAHHLP